MTYVKNSQLKISLNFNDTKSLRAKNEVYGGGGGGSNFETIVNNMKYI